MARSICIITALALLAGCARHGRHSQVEAYPYDRPLESPGKKFSSLPAAVQHTIRAQAGIAEMEDITRIDAAGQAAYRVDFRDAAQFPPLYVAADGSVLQPDLTVAVGADQDTLGTGTGGLTSGIQFSDLPIEVVQTIAHKAPGAVIDSINQIRSGPRVFYEVVFKGGRPVEKLQIAEDGTLVSEGQPGVLRPIPGQ